MSEPICQLRADDYENAMDFLNLVFSVYFPIDFPTFLPKLYKPTDEYMSMNYAIKRHGKIRAIVGLYPMELNMGNISLKLAGIGAVSSHPNDRGQGHMKRLMHHCLEVMRAEGYQLSWLRGDRQRYGFFGYDVCGTTASFTVTKKNVHHCYDRDNALFFEKILPHDGRLAVIKSWHDKNIIHCSRPLALFDEISRSWRHESFAALDKNGDMVGYINADISDGIVLEMTSCQENRFKDMIAAWVVTQERENVTFQMASLPNPPANELARFSEDFSLSPSGNWRVFDWQSVLDAALKVKHQAVNLNDGNLTLEIKGYGVLELRVDGVSAACFRSQKKAAFLCDPQTAMRLLFGPLSPAMVSQISNTTLNAWCPLPLYMPKQDEV